MRTASGYHPPAVPYHTPIRGSLSTPGTIPLSGERAIYYQQSLLTYLRATKRKKDGKIHHYWSVVENVRVGRRVFQRRALYLGELNDSQHAEWQRAIEAIDENGRVTQFRAVQTTIPDLVQHEASIGTLQAEKKALDDAIVEIDVKLKMDDEKLKRKGALIKQLTEAEAGKARWTSLNNWLGGAGGEKFKRYAQGITLRQLLAAANPHLSAMTQGRYELMWDPEETDAAKLLPSVVDKDQAGETRPVTNLSGGERFQVSLALALGLSEMSSNKLSVDSLFLDEGFGTLDSKTLEAALDTLCRIQQDGKLIGIISHVTEVGERIPTQIEVKKIGGGLSILEGAGVVAHS